MVDKNVASEFCSGCVLIKDSAITVLAPLSFVEGRETHLKVVFYDGEELDATFVSVEDLFCLLKTAVHSGCERVDLLRSDVACPQWTFTYVPRSCTTTEKLNTYVTAESLESYEEDRSLTINSTKYFMVSCDYVEMTPSGHNKLGGAPVFTMSGKTAGIVLQDADHVVQDPGAEMKVTLKSNCLHQLMMLLDPPVPSNNPRKKRKRSRLGKGLSGFPTN